MKSTVYAHLHIIRRHPIMLAMFLSMLICSSINAAPPPDFVIVVLPDTQFYSKSYPYIFEDQTQWIFDNKGALNIVYVAHEGDIVDTADSGYQWVNADEAMSNLEPDIPYSVVPGNHDEPTTFYNTYFGVSRFLGRSYYGGYYGSNNDNNYTLFSASGIDFIVINLAYDESPDTDILDWADWLLKTYSDRQGIVVSHYIIGLGNPGAFGTQGQAIYDALKDNPNLFLMLCGHIHGEGRRTDTFNGNTVYTLLADYQDRDYGGDGWLRILEFSPANNEIRVKTYSPLLDQYETDADSQFTLSYNMTSSVSFNQRASSGNESVTPANLSVSLSGASTQTVTVNYAVTGGTATGGGVDYTLSGGTLTFNPGETGKAISIAIVDDSLVEANETIEVTLSNPTNATLGANTVHTYTINDNESKPTVFFNQTASSGNESVTPANLSVSLSGASTQTVTVNYAVTGGTATGGGVDYTLSAGALTFNPGETAKAISIVIVDDSLVEANETIEVTLSNPTNATLGANIVYTYTINDNDATSVIPKTAWSLKYVDSEELVGENGAAVNSFDGNVNTIWHTQWRGSNPPPPHEIQINLGLTYDIDRFRYLPRQDGSANGRIGQYEFYVSTDGINWGTAVATGTFANNALEKEVVFTSKTGRYIRLRALTEVNGNPWTSMAEINVLGIVSGGNQAPNGVIGSPTGNVTINIGDEVSFAGTGSDPDGNLPLSFKWSFGAGSGIPDSTVEDPGQVQFNNSGTYTVTFTVTDALGLSDQTPATCVVTVLGPFELIPDWTNVEYPPFDFIPTADVTNPVLTASSVTDASAGFVADPFLFYENGMWYMFFEVFLNSTQRGAIALAKSPDGLHWNYDRIVLSNPWHNSYPFVLKSNGKYYLIPESYQRNAVEVYEASNFPYNWSYVSTIASGKPFTDPSIFRYDNTWWMFVSDTSNSNCYLYYSDNLLSGWVEHPMSPIISGDASKARSGGRPVVFDNGRVIRIAQKDNVVYGEAVRAFEVDTLTKTNYAEHEIPESPILDKSGSGWNASGMHQCDCWWAGNNWLCSVDGQNNGIWSIGIYITPNPSSPNGVIDSPTGDVIVNVGNKVSFAGTGSDPDGNLPLSFKWNFGTGSGIPDSTLEDPGQVQFNNSGTYTVTFTVTDALGLSDPTPATRVVTVLSGSSVIPQTTWSLKYVDSQELVGENGAAVNAFDGKGNTIWHTQWVGSNPPPPHEIQIDLGLTYDIDRFRYLPRQDGSANGRIGQYEFYISTDGVNWGTAVATGTFANNSLEKEVVFTSKTGRYIRLRALTEVNGNPWTSMAEINVLGVLK